MPGQNKQQQAAVQEDPGQDTLPEDVNIIKQSGEATEDVLSVCGHLLSV